MMAAEWKYLTEEKAKNLKAYSDSLIKELFLTDYNEDPTALFDLFYEFLYSIRNFDRLNLTSAIVVLEKIFKYHDDPKKTELISLLFINVLNLFPPNQSLSSFLAKLSINDKLLAIHLTSEYYSSTYNINLNKVKRQESVILRDQYIQKRYNLLHECSEGYSKLIVELYEAISSDDAPYMVDYTWRVIESLIGHFSLDPNRVLDIILDLYINNILKNYHFCIELLKRSSWWPLVPSDISCIENLSTGGCDIAAQLIGFKLNNYLFLGRDMPETFKCLIAVLIKEGFISFGAIYSYLSPNDEAMKKIESQYKAYMEDKSFKAGASLLALAAPLNDEEADSSNKTSRNDSRGREKNKEPKDPYREIIDSLKTNNKYQLLKVFLMCGLYWPSIFILAKYPFLPKIDPEIASAIHRLMNQSIKPLYEKVHSIQDKDLIQKLLVPKRVAFTRSDDGIEYEDYLITTIEVFSLQKSHTNKKFVYFYHEWNKKIPEIKTIEDLFVVCNEFLSFSSVNLYKDVELMTKLVRIGLYDLNNTPKDDYHSKLNKWFDFFRKFIFPAMPLIKENPCTIQEIFKLMAKFPLDKRFSLYGGINSTLRKKDLDIKIACNAAEKETKDVLKRLSKTNFHPMMRRLAKISYANPLSCFEVIVTQIESYDNLIDLIVDAARYFTDYGYDVLTFVLLIRLTSNRNSIQDDGINDRQWLQSLVTFIGKLCQRYAKVDLKTLYTFILKKFHSGDNTGIVIFKEMVNYMSGIKHISNLTLLQIEYLGCGPCLQNIVFSNIQDNRNISKRSGLRLLNNLIELDAISELFILLTNYHKTQIFENENLHYKILANRNDETSSLLHSYLSSINYFLHTKQIESYIMPLSTLISVFGVSTEWAFELWRKSLSKSIQREFQEEELNEHKPWTKTLYPIMKMIKLNISLVNWDVMEVGFYTTFWQLSLYDINFPSDKYKMEQKHIKDSISGLTDDMNNLKNDPEATLFSIDAKKKLKEEYERILEEFPDSMLKHEIHYKFSMKRIENEKDSWFKNNTGESDEVTLTNKTDEFLESCILPRSIHSLLDALFCAKFLKLLLSLGFRKFYLGVLKVLFKGIISCSLFTFTPDEAENFGIFYSEIFQSLDNWRNKENFEKEFGKISNDESSTSHQEFLKNLLEIHTLSLRDISVALETDDYMYRRNAITFLKNVITVYPVIEDHCEKLLYLIETIAQDEREDIKLAANALIVLIRSREKKCIHMLESYEMDKADEGQQKVKRKILKDSLVSSKKTEAKFPTGPKSSSIVSRSSSRLSQNEAKEPLKKYMDVMLQTVNKEKKENLVSPPAKSVLKIKPEDKEAAEKPLSNVPKSESPTELKKVKLSSTLLDIPANTASIIPSENEETKDNVLTTEKNSPLEVVEGGDTSEKKTQPLPNNAKKQPDHQPRITKPSSSYNRNRTPAKGERNPGGYSQNYQRSSSYGSRYDSGGRPSRGRGNRRYNH
ncbi:Tho2p ASCRUDRAFT_73512, partial [Ascoidea rubescens DSM 1968]